MAVTACPRLSDGAAEHDAHCLQQLLVEAEGPAVDDVVQGPDEAEQVEQRPRHLGAERVKQHKHLVWQRAADKQAGQLEGEEEDLGLLPYHRLLRAVDVSGGDHATLKSQTRLP